jgi:hypothetical protein
MRGRWKPVVTTVGWLGSLVGVALVAYWAGRTAIAPPELPAEEHPVTTYAVAEGTVGRTVRVAVAAGWRLERTVAAAGEGVVTGVHLDAGAVLETGAVPVTIDLEPLVVAPGAIPMFRALQRGVEGPDVAQLQGLLRSLGFLAGPADGRFGPLTEAAVKRWQRAIGATVDGVVEPATLLFLDRLPTRAQVVPAVGDRIGIGDPWLRIFAASPTFRAVVSAALRAELASGMAIEINGPGSARWHGTLGTFTSRDDGRFEVDIEGDVCGDACATIPVDGEIMLEGAIVLVPETHGLVVPTAALIQGPSGGTAVTLADGATREVRIVAEANGFAVVEGLTPGTMVQLPAPPKP